MASAAGLVLMAGGLTAANEVVFAPVANPGKAPAFQWRIIPATLILTALIGGLDSAGGSKLAQGVGWTILATVTLAPVGNTPSPIENLRKIVG